MLFIPDPTYRANPSNPMWRTTQGKVTPDELPNAGHPDEVPCDVNHANVLAEIGWNLWRYHLEGRSSMGLRYPFPYKVAPLEIIEDQGVEPSAGGTRGLRDGEVAQSNRRKSSRLPF